MSKNSRIKKPRNKGILLFLNSSSRKCARHEDRRNKARDRELKRELKEA